MPHPSLPHTLQKSQKKNDFKKLGIDVDWDMGIVGESGGCGITPEFEPPKGFLGGFPGNPKVTEASSGQ